MVAGVRLGAAASRQLFRGRRRRHDRGVRGQLAGPLPLRLPGRLPTGRSGDAVDHRGGRLLRRIPRRDSGVEEAAPARDRQRPWIDRQLGDARVAVFVEVERCFVSESQQHVDHLIRSSLFSQQPSDGQRCPITNASSCQFQP